MPRSGVEPRSSGESGELTLPPLVSLGSGYSPLPVRDMEQSREAWRTKAENGGSEPGSPRHLELTWAWICQGAEQQRSQGEGAGNKGPLSEDGYQAAWRRRSGLAPEVLWHGADREAGFGSWVFRALYWGAQEGSYQERELGVHWSRAVKRCPTDRQTDRQKHIEGN